MGNLPAFLNSWAPRVLSILRIITGFLFIAHGYQKLFGDPPGGPPFTGLFTEMGIAGLLEFVGGILILVGFLTRPVAFILCGQMAVAYFKQHAKGGFLPLVNKGELAVLYCFVFLYFVFAGGGPWSLDALFGRNKSQA